MSQYQIPAESSPAHGAVAITPNDSTVFPTCRSIYVGTAGILRVRMADGQTTTFPTVAAGIFPIQVDKVLSTTTTATNLIALY